MSISPRKVFTITIFITAIGIGYYSMNAAPVLSDDSHTYHGDTGGELISTTHSSSLPSKRNRC